MLLDWGHTIEAASDSLCGTIRTYLGLRSRFSLQIVKLCKEQMESYNKPSLKLLKYQAATLFRNRDLTKLSKMRGQPMGWGSKNFREG